MAVRLREYHRPASVAEALALVGRGDVQTSLLEHGARIPVEPFAGCEAVVDLARLQLDGLTESGGLIHLGSAVSLEFLAFDAALNGLADGILSQAARLSAAAGVRRLATLGGLLAAPNDPPEVGLALLVLGATVVVQGVERREVALAIFRPRADEVILGVQLPRPSAQCGGALARVARSPLDRAVVAAVALVWEAGARVAVAGASPWPLLVAAPPGPPDAAGLDRLAATIAAQAEPCGDYLGSVEYRKAMAGVLARRALTEARQRMNEHHDH